MTKSNAGDGERALTLGAAALIGISAALMAQGAHAAGADDAAAATTSAPTEVAGVTVTTDKTNSENSQINLGTYTGAVKDTPQAIQVISQKLIQEQKITTLEQALRDVPGITVAIGEGGTLNGDQFKIRGQDAKDDVYIDGLKDFGAYVRDAFNDQEVQVLKGPSATAFGRGTTGAAINVVSKTPQAKDAFSADVAAGSGNYYRGDIDLNHAINSTTAVRLVVMDNRTQTVDRDDSRYDRWGVAPSVAFGLGTNTQLSLGYFYQHNNDRPDYGIPLALVGGTPISAISTSTGLPVTEITGATARPLTELGVNRKTNYGFSADHDVTDANMLTARFSQKSSDLLTFTDDARAGYYTRDFLATQSTCSSPAISGVSTTPHCIDYLQTGNPKAVVGIGGPSPYTQYTYGFQDIGAAHINVSPFGLKNQAVVGFDVNYEYNSRVSDVLVPAKATTKSVFNPSDASPFSESNATAANSAATATALRTSLGADYAAFFSDQLWFTPWLSVVGALRYDRYVSKYDTTLVTGAQSQIKSDSDLLNPKVALVLQPNREQTYYISWSRSATPQGSSVADANAAITSSALEPEKNQIYEAGAKFSLFHDRLGLDGAVFHIDKNNALQPDPSDPDLLLANSGQKQRIQGAELDVTGKLTKAWSVNFGYSYLDSKILSDFVTQTNTSTQFPNTFSIGREVYYTPRNAATLWTTYELGGILKGLTVGGGVTYQDRVYTNYVYVAPHTGNVFSAPVTIDYSSLIQYRWSHYTVALNGYNLTNRLNYSQVYTNRVLPEQGRSFVLTLATKY
jgi:catecholate siderophore receptor